MTMTLRTLTALLSTGALALSLAACGETDKDDDTGSDDDTDSDTDVDEDEDEDDTDTDEDEDEDEDEGLEADVLYMQYEVTLRDYDMVPYLYDGEEVEGFVYFWFVNSADWDGTDDTTNGCIVAYELSDIAGTPDADLNSEAWWGWELDTLIPAAEADVTNLVGWSDSCDDVSNLDMHPSEVVDAHTWGIGIGPLGDDLGAALADAYGEDWADYGPSAFGGYINIDAGTDAGGLAELSYGLAFGIEEDNTLIVDDENSLSFIEVGDDGAGGVGYFRAFPAYGLDATAL
jgi:hypothetical protein